MFFEQQLAGPTVGDAAPDQDVGPCPAPSGEVELEEVSATARERGRDGPLDELPERLETDRAGGSTQHAHIDAARAVSVLERVGEESLPLALDELDQVARVIGQLREVPIHVHVLDAQGWQRDVPQANAFVGVVMIAWVGDGGQDVTSITTEALRARVARGEVGVDVRAGAIDQGPHHGVRARRPDAPQPTHPAASQQARQHRLGLVVARVAHGEHVGPHLSTHRVQRLVASLARPGRGP